VGNRLSCPRSRVMLLSVRFEITCNSDMSLAAQPFKHPAGKTSHVNSRLNASFLRRRQPPLESAASRIGRLSNRPHRVLKSK